jgi:hypothetical protein
MTAAAVQWEAVAGVTHAWMAQCEAYVSLCGREVSGFGGQRSGIRCGQCTASSGWAEQTGEPSYLTPYQHPVMEHPRRRAIERIMVMPLHPRKAPEHADSSQANATEPAQTEERRAAAQIGPILSEPDSLDAYARLPEVEQRYWAPMMLGHIGHEAIWDRVQETAEQFQQRCYEQLEKRET